MIDGKPYPQIASEDLPIRAGTFYKKRDERTDRIAESNNYRDAKLLLLTTPDVARSYAGQISLLTAANITSRFCRHVDVITEDVPVNSGLATECDDLHTQCAREMQAADPFASFRISTELEGGGYEAALVFGDKSVPANDIIHASGNGWLADISRTGKIERDEGQARTDNPIGPAVAACLGIAEMFKSVIGVSKDALSNSITFDAFRVGFVEGDINSDNHPEFPDTVSLGDIQMVGVGAVGSATLYFLRYLPLNGTLTLIDHDNVEYSNLNRSPLFSVRDAFEESYKTHVGERFIQENIPTTAHTRTYSDFVKNNGAGTPDVVIPVANEQGVRATIQENYPPLMVHTTTGDWKVHVRRHIPTVDACLRCHFPVKAPRPQEGCARGELPDDAVSNARRGEDNPDAALPFVSILAGALLTGELVKLTLPDYPFTLNSVEVGVNPTFDYPSNWSKRDDCGFCSNLSEGLYQSMIQDSKFSTHSLSNGTNSN